MAFDWFQPRTDHGRVLGAALDEARARGDRRLSTEHLLLGLLHVAEPPVWLGVDLAAAHGALAELDRAALASIGLNVPTLLAVTAPAPRRRAQLSSGALAVLRTAVRASTAKTRKLIPRYLLLELLDRHRPDPAAELIEQLGIDRSSVRARLAG